jgi:hypothetical protein
MARQCNAFTVTLGSSNPGVLQKPIRINPKRKCTRIRCRATVTMTTTDSSSYNMTSANCVSLAGEIFGNFYLAFGDNDPDVVDANHPFAFMRYMYGVLEGKDFTIGVQNATSGSEPATMYALNAVTGSNVQIAASGTSTTTTLVLEFVRSFTPVRMGKELHDFCPGPSQMRQLNLSITPSGTSPSFDSAHVTATSASIVIILEDMPTKNDPWASVPKMRETTAQGTDIPLPIASGGGLLHVADLSEAATSSVLTLFNLVGDGVIFHGILNSAQALQEFEQDLPLGAFDVSTLGTPLYTTPVLDRVADLDTAEQLVFNQPNNDITSPQLVVLFIERWSQARVNQAGGNAATTKQGPVAVATLAAANGQSASETTASISPLNVMDPSEPAASLAPTVNFSPGSAPQLNIPNHLLSGPASTASSLKGGASSAYAANSAKALTAATPGISSPNKQVPSQGLATSTARILSANVKTEQDLSNAQKTTSAIANRTMAVR